MRQTSPSRPTVTLHELPAPAPRAAARTAALPEREQVVFVTNAVRRRGGLRSRAEEQHRPVGPVLAAVLTR